MEHVDRQVVAGGAGGDHAGFGGLGVVGGEGGQSSSTDETVASIGPDRGQLSIVAPSPDRVGADSEQGGRLSDPIFAHARILTEISSICQITSS